MNKVFLPLFLTMLCYTAFSQQTFTYLKKDNEVEFKSDTILVVFNNYIKTPEGYYETLVTRNGMSYRFITKKVNNKRMQEIVNSSGEKIATVLLTQKDQFDILLPDSTQLRWKDISRKSWSFLYNGKPVISGVFQKVGKSKQVILTSQDASFPTDMMQLIMLSHGIGKIRSAASTPALIATVAMLAVASSSLVQK